MPVDITDVSEFTAPIVGPADSDPADRTYVMTIAQGLANRTRHLNDRFDSAGRVLLPLGIIVEQYLGLPQATAINGWTTSDSFEWISSTNGAEMCWDLRPYLSGLAKLTQIAVLVDPGAARAPGGSYTIGDTMQITLRKSAHPFTPGTASRTVTTVATKGDNGTTNLQWVPIDLPDTPTISGAQSWQVRVMSSVADSATLKDRVYGLFVKGTADRLAAV